jgi:hypothetical protein
MEAYIIQGTRRLAIRIDIPVEIAAGEEGGDKTCLCLANKTSVHIEVVV